MYKIAGHVKYPYGVISPNDPSQLGLGYNTLEEAVLHRDHMNTLICTYGTDKNVWNYDHWKDKPEPYIVFTAD
jgi:hypothetical protein